MDDDVNRPSFRPSLNTLWDFTGVDAAQFPSDAIRELSEEVSNRMDGRGTGFKSAILVSTDMVFGLARMYEAYGDRLPIRREVFRDRDEAWAWLTEGVE